jgi:hypothetical protein
LAPLTPVQPGLRSADKEFMSVKSGSWFLELILNVLLLGGVAYVTFAARGEQERGLAVPLFAAVSPATTRPAVDTTPKTPLVPDPKTVGQGLDAAKTQTTESFVQAWGALQIWAAGLDGKITPDELKKIEDSMGSTWNNSSQSVRDYLKSVNDKINAGQGDQVIQDALRSLAQQANDKKMQVLDSVTKLMQSNGMTWDQVQRTIGQWAGQLLKLNPVDTLKSLKF